jgi:hypothetical protein
MKIKFSVKVGDRTIQIEDDVANVAEAWRLVAFWDSLPQAGPAGQGDLKFSYRTPQECEYFAIACPSSGQEFKFGQFRKDKDKLFPKHWAPILHGREEFDEEQAPEPAPAPARRESQSTRPASPAPPVAAPAPVSDIDSARYFAYQREHKIDFGQADEIRLECTVNKKTDWIRAFERLRELGRQPTSALTPAQMALQNLFTELQRHGVKPAELETRLSRICDGICELESLDQSQTAKAISVFQRDLDAKRTATQRQQQRSA